jgi:hypothetical protein
MSFNSLSNEIIIKIIEYLLHDEDLLSVGKTCRLLNALSAPYLYSSIGQLDPEWCSLFLRTISARPDLAAMVETYTGDENQYESDLSGPLEIGDFSEQSVAAMKKVITEVSGSEKEADRWEDDLFSDPPSFDAMTATMIALLPNLRELHMQTYGYRGDYPCIEGVLDHATSLQEDTSFSSDAPSPHSLSQLRVTSVQYWHTGCALDFSYVMPYLRIPSVRKFIGQQIRYGAQFLPFSSKVEDLDFFNTLFDPLNLIHLLKNCPCLRKFSYDDGGNLGGDVDFRPSALRQGLEPCRETLEKIYITAPATNFYYSGDEYRVTDPISFADFIKLRRIAVSAYVLIEPVKNADNKAIIDTTAFLQRLPRSLKALKLTECENRPVWPCVRELIRRKEEVAPNLKFVRLEHGYDRLYGPKGTGAGWIEECRRAGVKLFLQSALSRLED